MRKFREHKNKIITSKRDSQKLDEIQMLSLSDLYPAAQINQRLEKTLQHRLQSMTDKHYKIELKPKGVPLSEITNRWGNKAGNNIEQLSTACEVDKTTPRKDES